MLDNTTVNLAPGLETSRNTTIRLACIGAIILCGILIGLANLDNNYDDAFITFRYAYNLASGSGFVYNIGEHVLGTTAPFFGIVLALIGWATSPEFIPFIAGVLSAIAQIFSAIALFEFGRLYDRPFCGLLAGIFFVSSSFATLNFGGEMPFVTALILWSVLAYKREQLLFTSALLAIAIISRPDSALAAAILAVDFVNRRKRIPLRPLLLLICIVTPCMAIAYAYYGAILPATIAAKFAQKDSGQYLTFINGVTFWLHGTLSPGFLPRLSLNMRFATLLIFGGGLFLWRFRFWYFVLLWPIAFILIYRILNVVFYHWYLMPVIVGISILNACIIAGVVDLWLKATQHKLNERIRRGVCICIAALFLPWIYGDVTAAQRTSVEDPNELLYERTGHWLNEHTDSSVTIGYQDFGILGYYSHRKIIDPIGLVTPDVSPHLAKGDVLWAFRNLKPDYILWTTRLGPPFWLMLNESWFAKNYQQIVTLDQSGVEPITIYKARPPWK